MADMIKIVEILVCYFILFFLMIVVVLEIGLFLLILRKKVNVGLIPRSVTFVFTYNIFWEMVLSLPCIQKIFCCLSFLSVLCVCLSTSNLENKRLSCSH